MESSIPSKEPLVSPTLNEPDEQSLARLQNLYDAGRFHDAWKELNGWRAIRDWRSTSNRVFGGRLAYHLGAVRLSLGLGVLASRADRDDSEAAYFSIRSFLARRGPVAAWREIERNRHLIPSGGLDAALWLGMEAQILGLLRDFDRSERLLDRALAIAPSEAWIHVEAATIREQQDRYDESLEHARRALELRPWYTPAVLSTAQSLVLFSRNDEAIALLEGALAHIQSAGVASFLASLREEREDYDEAIAAWELFLLYSPLLEKDLRNWRTAHLSEIHYLAGRYDLARDLAAASEEPILMRVAKRLESIDLDGRRVMLEVPYIRQHQVTCVPTTLAMIGRYWQREIPHLELADEITYDGTPLHIERSWAENNGWVVRELTLDWDSAVALIDRGVPFTLTTITAGGGHEQAMIGYDSRRGTLLVRDPGAPGRHEYDMESLLETMRASGPRAMALVPEEKKDLVEGLELTDADLRDELYHLMKSLETHDREAAEHRHERLEQLAPGHALTMEAKSTLAIYDCNWVELAKVLDQKLALFPDDSTLLLQKLACLRDLSRSSDRLKILEDLSTSGKHEPVFLRLYAEALAADGVRHEESLRILRRYLYASPGDAEALSLLADLRSRERRHDDAVELYRFASCLDERNEQLAVNYYIAASLQGRKEEALDLLEARYGRLGARSAMPARTLFIALCRTHETGAAFELLGEAIARRSDDAELLLFTADAHARYGEFETASALLDRVRRIGGRSGSLLATEAQIAWYRGDLRHALATWSDVLESEPLNPGAWSAVAGLKALIEGRASSIEFIESWIERFPHHVPLHYALIDRQRENDRSRHETAVRRLLEIEPRDGWARRELALALGFRGEIEGALRELDEAGRIEPQASINASIRGQIMEMAGDRLAARAAYENALEISIDEPLAIHRIVDLSSTDEERIRIIRSLFDRLRGATGLGEAVTAWFDAARDVLPADELLEALEAIRAAKPDLWQCESAIIQHLLNLHRNRDAAETADRAVSRFALVPPIWLGAAAAWRAHGEDDKERNAFDVILRIEPANGEAAVSLGDLLRRSNELELAETILTDAMARDPLNENIPWILSAVAQERGDQEVAFERLVQAARLSPEDERIWTDLLDCTAQLRRGEALLELVHEIVDQRPGDPISWMALARVEPDPDSRMTAARRAIDVDPWCEDAYHLFAEILAESERYEEAIEICSRFGEGRVIPLGLRGRAAWVRAMSGDLDGAISAMKEILQEEPGYRWGWMQLANWFRYTERLDEYVETARQLTKLEPRSPVVWSNLGDAELQRENVSGARRAFRKAISLDPDAPWPALALFDLEMEHGSLDAARDVIDERIVRFRDLPDAILARLRFDLRSGDQNAALSRYREIATNPDATEEHVSEAARLLRDEGLKKPFRKVALEVMEQAYNSGAARIAIEVMLDDKKWKDAEQLVARLRSGSEPAAAIAAARRLVEVAAHFGEPGRMERFIQSDRSWFTHEPYLYGTVAYGYTTLEIHAETIEWMKDWMIRDDVEGWMLLSLADSLRHIKGRESEAAEVSRAALRLPADGSRSAHVVWLALDDALADLTEQAMAALSEIDTSSLDAVHSIPYALLLSLVDAEMAGPEWKNAIAPHLSYVASARRGNNRCPMVSRLYSLTIRTIRQRKGAFFWWLRRSIV